MATAKRTYDGACQLCGVTLSKRKMLNHLPQCPRLPHSGKPQVHLYEILVEGQGMPQYWLMVEIPTKATLQALDTFLRDTWLECCGHLSVFKIQSTCYYGDDENVDELGGATMDAKLRNVLQPGDKFTHEYDFGSTTYLKLTVIGERTGPVPKQKVALLARNLPPDLRCKCGQPATQINAYAQDEESLFWCDDCSSRAQDQQDAEEIALLPLVNSPRTGVCGYTGTA